jgi:hypothetical protein
MGALQTSIAEVLFKKGLDTKTNPKLVLPGSLLVLENGVFTEGVTIKKRNGYVALARDVLAATALTKADALGTFGNELLLFSSGSLYSWSTGLQKWTSRGSVAPLTAKVSPIFRNTYKQSNPDSATVNGVSCYVWTDGRGGVRAQIVDDSTGSVLLADVSLNATAVRPRVTAVQNNFVVVYQSGANIIARSISSLSPTAFTAEVTLATDGHGTAANQHVDLCPSFFQSTGPNGVGAAFFAYNTSTASTLKVGYVRADGSLGQASNGYPAVISIGAAADKSIGLVCQSTGDIYVLYSNGTNVSVAARYLDLTSKVAATAIEALTNVENVTGSFDSSGNLQVFYEVQAALSFNRFTKTAQVSPAGAVSGVAVHRRSVALASKAWTHSTGVYVTVVHDPTTSGGADGLQNTYFVVRLDGTIVARLQSGNADKIQVGQVPSVRAGADGNTFSISAPVRTQFVTSSTSAGKIITYSLVGLANVVLTFGKGSRSAPIGNSLLIAGGFLGCYDGQSVVENGFHLYPENIAAPTMASGGALEAGTRQMCFVYEWIDAQGQTHRSNPSVPISFVATANQKATFAVPTLRMTGKQAPRTNVQIVGYCTIVGGTDFYRCPNDPSTDPVGAPLYNDPTVDTVNFVRSIADTGIQANQLLYTQGGILENIPPPSSRFLAVTKNRVFLGGLEDTRRVWVSKNAVRGEGVAFNDQLYIEVDPSGGDLTALAVLDEKTIFFKRNQIEVVTGDAPDDAGQNGTITPPIVVTTDAGCVDAASIAAFPNGLVFKADKGIYALTRSLEAIYIGAPVEAYNGFSIVSAQLVEKSNQVRFLLSDNATCLVWDYLFNEWSVFTNHGGVDSAIWLSTNGYVYLRSDGKVMTEAPGVYTDDGTDIHMRMKTAWIKLAGLQGFQRVRRVSFLGDFYSDHQMRVRIAYDYQPFQVAEKVFIAANAINGSTWGSDATWGSGSAWGGAGNDLVYQWQIHLARQKCEAIQFELEDVASTPGQGYSIAGLALQVGLLPGGMRLPNRKSL